jgi:hypothetical protein
MQNKMVLLWIIALSISGCLLETKHEIDVKPMHITIDVNLKIQEELKEKFKQTDEQAKSISEKEAEEALKQYLATQSAKK